MRKRMLFAGAATLALALAGCGSNVEPGFVAKQWAGEMRELQINPVFPPREDFQVGDIYLPAVPQDQVDQVFDDEGYLPMSVWLMEAGGDGAARKALKSFYDKRSTYPQTTKAVVDSVTGAEAGGSEQGQNGGNGNQNGGTGDAGLSGPVSQPVLDCEDVANGTDCNIFTGNEKTKMRRMRIVGFPTFLSTTITQGNLSAFVPVEAFSAALGLDVGNIEAVSVNVPVAESVALPAMTALALASGSFLSTEPPLCPATLDAVPNSVSMAAEPSADSSASSSNGDETSSAVPASSGRSEKDKAQKLGAIAALLPARQRDEQGRARGIFHAIVVNEVFYTRAIEISIKTQQSFGLGARLQALTPPGTGGANSFTGQQMPESNGDDASEQTGTPRSTTVPSPVETYNRLLQATSNLPSAPGGSLKVVSVSDGNIGMRRMFDRPIAIGYRGLSLQVNSRTCEVLGGGPVGDGGMGPGPLDTGLGARTSESSTSEERSEPDATRGRTSGGSGLSAPLEDEGEQPADM